MTDRKLGVLVHGHWGGGKSWFGDTAPGPRLLISAEGQHVDTPSNKVAWDPRYDLPSFTDDDTVVVNLTDFSELAPVRTMLRIQQHPFESVVVDSLTELQDQTKVSISAGDGTYNPDAIFDQQKWGRLLNHLALFCRELRDYTRDTAKRPIHYVIICGTDKERTPYTPLLEGALRRKIGGWPNIEGFMKTISVDGAPSRVMVLNDLDDLVEVKCNVHAISEAYGLGMIDPTFDKLLEVL